MIKVDWWLKSIDDWSQFEKALRTNVRTDIANSRVASRLKIKALEHQTFSTHFTSKFMLFWITQKLTFFTHPNIKIAKNGNAQKPPPKISRIVQVQLNILQNSKFMDSHNGMFSIREYVKRSKTISIKIFNTNISPNSTSEKCIPNTLKFARHHLPYELPCFSIVFVHVFWAWDFHQSQLGHTFDSFCTVFAGLSCNCEPENYNLST